MASVQHFVNVPCENKQKRNKTPNNQGKGIKGCYKILGENYYVERSEAILVLSVAAVSLDPFFFYIPVVKNASTCLGLDSNLRIIVVVLRSFVDVLHTILWWRHSWLTDDISLDCCQGHLGKVWTGPPQKKGKILAWTVAILATLPLPQVVIFAVSWQPLTIRLLKFIVLIQFIIRVYRIIPAYKDATRSSDMLLIYTWFAAAFNLIMYTIASNVLGAFWYLRAVERNIDCWEGACHKNISLCGGSFLYCDDTSSYNVYLYKHCSTPQASNSKSFDYGIYDEAFHTIITKTDTPFLNKFFRCFWWGLRNLSSLGQNLNTGSYIWDSFFALAISISGLILFALLIGNMQTYLQSKTATKLEKMRQRKDNLLRWNPFYLFPKKLRRRVTWCDDPNWRETIEVNLESLLNNIQPKLRKALKPCLCKCIFSKVEEFKKLRNEVKEDLRERATPIVFQARSVLHRKGYPIHEMIHIVEGKVLAFTEDSDMNEEGSRNLQNGDCIGEELLEKVIDSPLQKFPLATETILSLTKVEAFTLSYDDLVAALTNHRYPSYREKWAKNILARAIRKKKKSCTC